MWWHYATCLNSPERRFVHSNILVYSSIQDEKEKHNETLHFLEKAKGEIIFVSTQVINEVYSSLLKHELKDEDIQRIVSKIIDIYNISLITISTIKSAWKLRSKYSLSYWDSLIAASSLENNCSILYLEDMQGGQVIEEKLKIINPFK